MRVLRAKYFEFRIYSIKGRAFSHKRPREAGGVGQAAEVLAAGDLGGAELA
jgi:hypothetical protein